MILNEIASSFGMAPASNIRPMINQHNSKTFRHLNPLLHTLSLSFSSSASDRKTRYSKAGKSPRIWSVSCVTRLTLMHSSVRLESEAIHSGIPWRILNVQFPQEMRRWGPRIQRDVSSINTPGNVQTSKF